jgi:hypothetical protein
MAVATVGETLVVAAVLTTAVQVAATNTLRRGLLLQNTGTVPIYVGIGTGNAATTGMIAIAAATTAPTSTLTGFLSFGAMEPNVTGKISLPAVVPMGDISVISTASASASLNYTEW